MMEMGFAVPVDDEAFLAPPKALENACDAVRGVLKSAETNGNVFLPCKELVQSCQAEYPYMASNQIADAIQWLTKNGTLDAEQNLCAFHKTRMQETTLAAFFARCIKECGESDELYATRCKAVAEAESSLGIVLSESQRAAAAGSLSCAFSVISGGAGSGKTTLLKTICEVMREDRAKALLMAPTGKAARRLAKQARHPAHTIHSVLYSTFPSCFREDGKYLADLIVIDEASMIDVPLMYDIIRHLGNGNQLILVGDPAQLPSVGPGHILCDIIDSGVNTYRLTDNFRQAESPAELVESIEAIRSMNAQSIHFGTGFCLLPASTSWETEKMMLDEYVPLFRDGADVQILSPVRKTQECGSDVLNASLQRELNPPKAGENVLQISNKIFHVGDKIVQTKNNDHARNGDVGYIREVRVHKTADGKSHKFVTIAFDDVGTITYSEEYIKTHTLLDHAWALTIHKAQGSEYDYVILPLIPQQHRSWYCNMIYTAVSRARKGVILVGDEQILQYAIQQPMPYRYTNLYEKIGILTHRRISA